MAHFTRVRVDLAAWGYGTAVDQAEFNKFDTNLFKAINGDDGGTWAPSAVIAIGGAGVEITGGILVSGAAATFTSATNLNGATTSNGAFVFASGGGSSLTVSCNATYHGVVTFSGLSSVTFNSTATFASAIAANGTANFGAAVNLNAATTANGAFTGYGNVTLNLTPGSEDNEFEVNIPTNFNHNAYFYGQLRSYGTTVLGNEATDTVSIGGTSSFSAPATFNSTAIHAGQVHETSIERVTASGTINRNHTDPRTLIATVSTALTVNLTRSVDTPDGIRKLVINSFRSTASVIVKDSTSGFTIATLAAGERIDVMHIVAEGGWM